MCGSEVHEGLTALRMAPATQRASASVPDKRSRGVSRREKRQKEQKKIKEMQMEGIKRAKQGKRSELDRMERMRNEGRDRGCIKMRGEGWRSEARCWPYVVIAQHPSR